MQLDLFRDDYCLREHLSTKARNIRIEVRPGREVRLVYPRWAPRAEALAFLHSREVWVRQKLAEQAARDAASPTPPQQRWDGTDEILLRGTLVPVCIEPANLRQVTVRVEPEVITVFTPSALRGSAHKLEPALRRELMQRARSDARRLLDEEAPRLGVRWTGLGIADPQTQWGSCAPTGAIALSWRLLMAPPAVFRYVVVHELCHLLHMDHSDQFWALVGRQQPDYQTHKRWLREHGQRLHLYLPRRRR